MRIVPLRLAVATLAGGLALAALPGCGDEKVTNKEPSAELKASEAKYGEQIAKNKAAAPAAAPKKK